MKTHELKVHPQFWRPLIAGDKPFEIRRNDRNFAVGDKVRLREFDPSFGYTGSGIYEWTISFVFSHEDFPMGLHRGFVALGFGYDEV